MYSIFASLILILSMNSDTPRVAIPFVTIAPSIDGCLDEPLWKDAAILDGFKIAGSETDAPLRTEVRLVCDGAFLYAGFYCEEPEMDKVKEAMKTLKEASWDVDMVEIHLDIPHGEPNYREFMVNPNGMGSVGYALDETAAKEFRSAAVYEKSAWTAECALPIKAFGVNDLKTQAVWGGNIRRFRTFFSPDKDESYQWTGNPFGFRDNSHHGELVVGQETGLIVESVRFNALGAGPGNPVHARLANRGAPRALTIHTHNENSSEEEKTSFTLGKGEFDIIAGLTLAPTPAEQRIGLSIEDSQSGESLYSRNDLAQTPPGMIVEIIQPAYRGLLTPDDQTLRGELSFGFSPERLYGAQLELTVEHGSRVIHTQRLPINGVKTSFSLDSASFAQGENELMIAAASAKDDSLAERSLPIRKETSESLAAIHARVDKDLRLKLDGKPFFPLGWYSGGNPDHMREMAEAGPFNCVLDYGINHKSFEEIGEYLDLADKLGMKIIFCCNDLYPEAKYFTKKSVWNGNQEIAETTIRAFRNHPAVITWYLNDELPLSMLGGLFDYDYLFRRLAPDQPTLLVHYQSQLLDPMAKTADILGLDEYPVPRNALTAVSDFIDQGYAAVKGTKPVWMVLQAFGWYQYRDPEKTVEGNPRARIPSEKELQLGRAPTREETRCMTYLALTHNAKGLLYYCYYDLRVLPQYQEMWGWLKEIGAEVKTLFPALLSTDTIVSHCEDARIHHLARRIDKEITLLAVNGTKESGAADISLDSAIDGQVEVLFENRSVSVKNGRIRDDFAPMAAHVYRLRWEK